MTTHTANGGTLRKTVAEFFEVEESQVGPTFSFQGRGQSSMARAALDALIRRKVGRRSRTVYTAKTYGELEAELLSGAASSPTGPAADNSPMTFAEAADASKAAPLRCGVDIERIDSLPRTADFWEEPFYRSCFTRPEIAYCLLQEFPPVHLAARWCAKEALKKCDGAFLAEEMNRLEVCADPSGSPYLVHHSGDGVRRLPHAVSLSHTTDSAVAVVVLLPERPVGAAAPEALAPSAPLEPRSARPALSSNLIAVAALAVAILTLALRFLDAR